MIFRGLITAVALSSIWLATPAGAQDTDPARDILVTFDNQGARVQSTSGSPPYRNRKRYAIAAEARHNADSIRDEYSLLEIDHWPIRSLSIYCFVYRIPPDANRDNVIESLRSDERIESVQALQEFETSVSPDDSYDDTYANLQHGLTMLSIGQAHRVSRGRGVRVAMIDGDADYQHEDLQGRVSKVADFAAKSARTDDFHGTAVASVIGANANNAKGIVGIAPEANLELYVACWADESSNNKALCDSFTLAKALDSLLGHPPDILNMSLTGPFDPLLARLLDAVSAAGVVIVAARPAELTERNRFPSSLDTVIGVGNSEVTLVRDGAERSFQEIFAPGEQVMVAIPNDAYDFRSGSSLAAAHVSGAIALLLAVSPNLSFDAVLTYLRKSQAVESSGAVSINACVILQLADPSRPCQLSAALQSKTGT